VGNPDLLARECLLALVDVAATAVDIVGLIAGDCFFDAGFAKMSSLDGDAARLPEIGGFRVGGSAMDC
jgi:hypothetical protein